MPSDAHSAHPVSHTPIEDIQAVLIGCLFVALALVMLRENRLLTGGTTGLSFILHYLSGWRLGVLLFAINLPFYIFGLRALGRAFTFKTFCAVGVLSLYAETLPQLVRFERLDPLFGAHTFKASQPDVLVLQETTRSQSLPFWQVRRARTLLAASAATMGSSLAIPAARASQDWPTKAPIKNEAGNGLSNARGTIAMARTSDPVVKLDLFEAR